MALLVLRWTSSFPLFAMKLLSIDWAEVCDVLDKILLDDESYMPLPNSVVSWTAIEISIL